jgi:hypothetical protein
MTGFIFRLELEDGTPADPPVLHTAVPNWQAGDTIPLNTTVTLRVLRVLNARDPREDPVLVVDADVGGGGGG